MINDERIEQRIEFENAMSFAILQEITQNIFIKNILQQLADNLLEHILNPLIIAAENFSTFETFSQHHRHQAFGNAIIKLAMYHSNEKRQYGATLRDKFASHKDIINDMQNIKLMLNTIKNALTHIEQKNTVDDIVKTLKATVDLGIVYTDGIERPEKKTTKYKTLLEKIFISPREEAARIYRAELDLAPVYATSFGIGKDDLIEKEKVIDTLTIMEGGKTLFWGVSTEKRLRLIAKKYRECYATWNFDRSQSNTQRLADIKKSTVNNYGQEVAAILCSSLPETEIDFETLADQLSSSFEKTSLQTALPLIAMTSGSLGRTLIALLMHDGLCTNGKVDLNKLQIFSNCIAGFFTYAGHHSISETAETYNKTLDYLTDLSNKPKQLYYQYGKYETFLHEDIREAIMEKARLVL